MSMTRQDYIAIAGLLAEERRNARDTQAVSNLTRALADLMASGNPNFDRLRFYAAAGMRRASYHDTCVNMAQDNQR